MHKLNVRTSIRRLATATALATILGSIGGLGSALNTAHAAGAAETNYVFQDDFGAVSVVGGTENNNVTVTLASGVYTITDTAHALTTWSPCQSVTANTVKCPAVPGTNRVTILGLDGDDYLRGGSEADTIRGGNGVDQLWGGSGIDSLFGDAGGDVLIGGPGSDTMAGGADRDQVQYVYDAVAANVDLTTQVARVNEGTVTLPRWVTDCLSSIEDVVGSRGNDVLTGNAGSNTFVPLEGNDVIDGRLGQDRVKYNWSAAPVTVSLATGLATGQGTDKLTNIEDATGSLGDDALIGNAGPNVLAGRTGNDKILGGAGDDHLYGEEGNDSLVGGAGIDVLDGGVGVNTIIQ